MRLRTGSGTYSNEQNPFHTYNEPGIYTVTLKIGSDSCSSVLSYTLDTESPWNFNATPATLGLAAVVTSTQTPLALSGLKVFPNPATDLLRIGFSTQQAGDYELRITNIAGQLLNRQEYQVVNGANLLTTDVSKLVPGLYFATLRTDDQVQTVRFVKE
jgi:Secretion system C-terminal sorting domain